MSENRFVMVAAWMENGNINEFVKVHTDVNRLGLVCFSSEASFSLVANDGLAALAWRCHSGVDIYARPGNSPWESQRGAFLSPWPPACSSSGLKTNILIGRTGQAYLADFSLLTIVSDQSTIISSWVDGGTIRWMSPELLDPERFGLKGSRPTKQSDCYALGMVVYEVLSGQTPFASSAAPVVIRMILDGKRPGRPRGEEGELFTDATWEVLELCWKPRPSDRASVRAVLLSLGGNQEDVESDSDDQSEVTAKNSSMLSLFRPGLTSDSIPRYIGPTTARQDSGIPAPPPWHSSRGIPVGRMAHGARKTLKSVIKMIRCP